MSDSNMVKNRIKVYARLKKESKGTKRSFYKIVPHKDCDHLTIFPDGSSKGSQFMSRFDKVFNSCSSQSEIFDGIAKPVINGLMNGFNGTIFAYGPTGSGKTYSLTGSHTKYNNRGLIPRTIEYVFSLITKSLNNYAIYISYLEIYNEVAYDLLNHKENVTTLEELPRVFLLEDNKGEAHFKNLSLRSVCSEEEAMRLLFLGDTNRTIAETPLNEYSSRSHCIFTVHLASRNRETGKIRKSKLNLVDLAGSERLHKMNLSGITLNEAKYINLSLHYLEQVILAISESKRAHIPYRNSIMTFMLRDSISGNCLTAMLATLAITKFNIEETISTCKFAQRVSMVKTDVAINEETDPQIEISILRNENLELRKALTNKRDLDACTKLSKQEEEDCKNTVKKFINGTTELPFDDSRKVRFYFEILRENIRKSSKDKTTSSNSFPSETEQKYKQIIKQKDEEISILMNIFKNKMEELKLGIPSYDSQEKFLKKTQRMSSDKITFNEFLLKPENKKILSFYTDTLDEKYKMAEDISRKLAEEQTKIINIRHEIDANYNFDSLEQLSFKLRSEQNIYRELLLKLQNIKSEIEFLKHGMAQAKLKLFDDFKKWLLKENGIQDNSTNLLAKTNIENGKGKLSNYASVLPLPHYNVFSQSQNNLSKSPLHDNGTNGKFDINAELDALFNKSLDYNMGQSEINSYLPQEDFLKCGTNKYVSPRNGGRLSPKLQKPVRDIDYVNVNLENLLSTTFVPEEERVATINNVSSNEITQSMTPTKDNDVLNFNTSPQIGHRYSENRLANDYEFTATKNSAGYLSNCKPLFISPRPKSPLLIGSHPVSPNCSQMSNDLFYSEDKAEFVEFMKTVPLTGDHDVDDEIVKFYRIKFKT